VVLSIVTPEISYVKLDSAAGTLVGVSVLSAWAAVTEFDVPVGGWQPLQNALLSHAPPLWREMVEVTAEADQVLSVWQEPHASMLGRFFQLALSVPPVWHVVQFLIF
jgi:hypothetical protein